MVGQVQRCGTAGCQYAGLCEGRSMHHALLRDQMAETVAEPRLMASLPLQEVHLLAGDGCVTWTHNCRAASRRLPLLP